MSPFPRARAVLGEPGGRRAATGVVLSLLIVSSAAADRPRVYAVTGGTAVVAPGKTVENATVVLRDGLIESVERGGKVPADAVAIDATGSLVYAGWIDTSSRLEVLPSAETADGPPVGRGRASAAPTTGPVHPIERVRPERRARDALSPFSEERAREMRRMRDLGFTTLLVAPRDGILRGSGVVVQLADERPVSELILRDAVTLHAGFDRGSFGGGYPTSLMGAVAAIRQTLLDAQRYATWNTRWTKGPEGMRRPEFHAAYEALGPVISGARPLVFQIDDPHDALLADRIGREIGIEILIDASGHEWEIADRIAVSGRTLLFPVAAPEEPDVRDADEALEVSLRTLRRYVHAPSGPARLHEAGVRFAFTTRGMRSTNDLRKQLAAIVAAGLPESVALAAFTTVPAELLGLERVLGTLEPGKVANLVIAGGSLFEEKADVTRVFVDGIEYVVEAPSRPKGDPDAVVDPRGTWAVVFDMGGRSFERVWTISGEKERLEGTAETREGVVAFDEVTLAGNALSVVFPGRGGRSPMEVTVIVEGERFEGVAEMGPRSVDVRGTRTAGPEAER